MDAVDGQAILNQVVLGWVAVGLFVAVLVMHRTALLGFTIFAAFNLAVASHSALLWSSLMGLDYAWVSPEQLAVFNYTGWGLVLFAVGVFIAWKPLRLSAASDPSGQNNPISGYRAPPWLTPQFVLLCMCIGAAGYVLTPITRFIPTVHAIWSIFFEWLNVGIIISGFYSGVTRRYKVVLLSLAVFFPLALVRVVGDGHVGALGLFVIHFGLVFLLARKVRLPHLALLGLFTVALGPVASTWFQIRGFVRQGAIQGNAVQRVMTLVDLFLIYYQPFDIDGYRMREVLFLRFDMGEIYSAQVRTQPESVPFQYGRTVSENLLVTLVPRILWPDKPVRVGGTAFVSKFTGMYEEGEEGAVSVGMPINFEFFANFGPLGAAVLTGLYGYLCARLELNIFRRDFRDLPKLLRAFVYMMICCTAGGNVTISVFMRAIPGLLGIWVAGRVIETLRKTMRFNKDFLTPLDPKKKLSRVIVTGEAMVPAVAGVGAGNGGKSGGRPRPTFAVPKAREFGFRRWEGPGGK